MTIEEIQTEIENLREQAFSYACSRQDAISNGDADAASRYLREIRIINAQLGYLRAELEDTREVCFYDC